MSEPPAPAPCPAERERIDWSAYRSVELGQKIGSALSLSERVGVVFRALILVMLGIAAIDYGLLLADARWLRVLGTGYGLVSGAVVGVFVGVAWMVYAEIQRVEELLVMMLDLSARIARDREAMRDGADARPTPAELLPPVYEHVVGPMVGEVVKTQLGLLGRPAAWILDAVLGRAVGLLAGLLEKRGITWASLERSKDPEPGPEGAPHDLPETPREVAPGATPAPQPEEESPERVGKTRVLVQQVGASLRGLFVPIWLILLVLALVFISPVAVVAYLAG